MTSTVTAATMTVKITETIKLNGRDQGAENTISIASVNEVSKRIVTATTTEQIILAFGTAVAAGQFDETKVVYIRITNLDDTNHVCLIFRNENGDEFSVKLDKGQSFIYNGDLATGVVDTMDALTGGGAGVTPNTFGDLVDITADADTASCDLELFVASI
tara:strand:- start:3465 stop:3944 length:480 start_codon:yes stop_codon:yes gene_type:complete